MPPEALAIVIASTFMHAGWNLLVRRGRSELEFTRRMLIWAALIGLAPAVLFDLFATPLGLQAWALAALAGAFCGVYFLGLAKGYSSSDFTVVYPVVRALPVILIAAVDVLLGRWPTALGWLGMMMVVGGCFLAPLPSFRALHVRLYFNRAVGWMVLAALSTVGYTLTDKVLADHLELRFGQGPAAPLRYVCYFFLVCTGTYLLMLRVLRIRSDDNGSNGPWWTPPLAAALSFSAYACIVWVYQFVDQVSYVAAVRQFSIVLGVVIAFVIFHEPGKLVRCTAAVMITAGLVIIGLWGN